jgi:hypothetical protein
MSKLTPISSAVVLACFLSRIISPTVVEATPEQHAILWEAEVLAEQPKVFQDASTTSRLVMQLRKGDGVSVVLKITVSGVTWCRVELKRSD